MKNNSKVLKVLSLFSGIGAFEKALTNIGINYKLIGFSEINKPAIKGFCSIHNVSEELNLGDITKIDKTKLENFDLLLAGFPCQDTSRNGKQAGIKKGTRSGLVHYAIDIIKYKKPKFVIFENVKDFAGNKFKDDFNAILEDIESSGYKSYCKLLNAKDFGLVHNRERIFMIFIREDIEQEFDFNLEKLESTKTLDELLMQDDHVCNISEVAKQKIISQSVDEDIILGKPERHKEFKNKVVCLNSKNKEGKQPSQQYRVYSRYGLMTTISSQLDGRYNVISSYGHLRKITPREAYLLQGFSEEDFLKVKHLRDSDLYKTSGNSIPVSVAEQIFKRLFEGRKYRELKEKNTSQSSVNIYHNEQLTFL